MADAAKAGKAFEFYTEYTKVWLEESGTVKIQTGKNKKASAVKPGETIVEWIQMPLNDEGMKYLKEYRDLEKDQELTAWPVSVGFPWFKGGLEPLIDQKALEAFKVEWAPVLAKTGGKMTLDISGDVVGNARIRINRIMTPGIYERFCKPYPTTTGTKEKSSRKRGVAIVQM